jgi:Family of unknown function (DUF5985)
MAEAIYLLCALTSLACTVLLGRSWIRRRERLLVWSTICFAALTANNCMLFIDLALVKDGSLLLWRNLTALLGLSSLLAGLIWETT